MPRHRITTDTLLREISDRREAEASERWRELQHDFMRTDGDAGNAPADRDDPAMSRTASI